MGNSMRPEVVRLIRKHCRNRGKRLIHSMWQAKKKKNFRRTHAGSSNWSMVIPFTKLGNQKRGLSLGQKKEKFSF